MTQVSAPGEGATARDPAVRRRVRGATLGLLLALIVQFLAGMWVNLFVSIPDAHPGARPGEYFSGSAQSVAWVITQSDLPALVFHAVLGLLLVGGSASLIVQVRRLHRRSLTAAAVLGFLLVLGAGFNGASPRLRRGLQLDDHGDAVRAGAGVLRVDPVHPRRRSPGRALSASVAPLRSGRSSRRRPPYRRRDG